MPLLFPFSCYRLPYLRILTTVLVTAGLLCAGMRVPDLSRPHRPKPMHRVVLKAQVTTLSSQIKQHQHHDDFFITLPQLPEPAVAVFGHAVASGAPPQHASPLPAPNSGRSPPAAHPA